MKTVLAIDFGASSGRAILGFFDGKKITLKEVHRFVNEPILTDEKFCWNIDDLFCNIKEGIKKASEVSDFESIAIDTWGVDFGIITKDNKLLENPYHYRDKRTSGILEKAFEIIPESELYNLTGNQIMEMNTLFQLLTVEDKEIIDKILLMPDLFNFLLTGEKYAEATIASTTQMFDRINMNWNYKVTDRFGYNRNIFPPIIKPGTKVGMLKKELCEELNVSPKEIIAVASHDTASAVAAVPSDEKDFIFISCGTWSLFGTVTDLPVISEKSNRYNITNEFGFNDKTRFLKNIIGLWLIQETKRQYEKDGKNYSYADMEKLALESEPFRYFIDPDDPMFIAPGNMPERICRYLEKTNQGTPQTDGEIIRCIYESIALKYKNALEIISDCTGKEYSRIHIVGGGTKDNLLCQLTANATGRKVLAGPIEATALGNIAVQLYSKGYINDISEVIMASSEIKEYIPENTKEWEKAYNKFERMI